jgi:hypothetical protein
MLMPSHPHDRRKMRVVVFDNKNISSCGNDNNTDPPPVGERIELLAGMGDGIIPSVAEGREPEGVVVMAAIAGASFDLWSRWAKALIGNMTKRSG